MFEKPTIAENIENFKNDYPHLIPLLDWAATRKDRFIRSVYGELAHTGYITQNQINCINDNFKKAQIPITQRLSESDRETVSGEIIGFKEYVCKHGRKRQMLVALPSNLRVYGTLPKQLQDAQRGDKVTFTAQFKPDENGDKYFFTFSRPVVKN